MTNSRGSKLAGAAAALLLVGAVSAACGGNGNGGSGGKSAPHMDAPAETAAVYKANCVSCHGSDLQGRIGPDTDLQKVGARMSVQEIADQITNGGRSMPAMKDRLTEDEIAGLAEWLAGKK